MTSTEPRSLIHARPQRKLDLDGEPDITNPDCSDDWTDFLVDRAATELTNQGPVYRLG